MPVTTTRTATRTDGGAAAAALAPVSWKMPVTGAVVVLLAALMAATAHGRTRFQLATSADFFQLPVLTLAARPVILLMALAAAAATALAYRRAVARAKVPAWVVATMGAAFVVAFLTWAGAGRDTLIPLVTILASTVALSVPLVFGGLAGVVGERSGTINIAIEGQLLGGAFFAAVAASVTSNAWIGLLAAPFAGMLVALLLALFGLRYRVNQVVVGVVLNVLVSGLTGFFFSTFLADSPTLNRAMRLPTLAIPLLSHVPVLGPVLFKQTILVYALYAVVGVLSFMLFRSRWGLRMRAVGEHPKAADTVGIKVMRTRVNNLVLGGALAGLGGAFFTVGSGLRFTEDMSGGNGYIALAAMILGAWNPLGTLYASLLFGFATAVGQTLGVIGSPIPANFVLMIPYVVTILAVAGFVGKVRAPAAEGVPYP
ncbi:MULTISPECIES: ABC transporter permease [unclassified Actinomyces]|uniref:ABC transporter permease n=1 Tax=unclassified Actinomyces TaxID=2609248 RepID=UPI002016E892|nr:MULTISPECIES: ABC transporter permease [unclassified Actinomyces]MCL3777697.1 ABC transporter permease [Actinomyces sp. AC-20-1]MCL3790158.1 ABC transporter permease [Actinomyces sp. 187325]MCL3792503.1 ABC transporter permease [Actinomyces sp. 186855]MCL3793850.1 ABC transporter permease [Actinomyces sp. 217892]